MDALTTEWNLFQKAIELSTTNKTEASESFFQVTEYELPIILAQLKQANQSPGEINFVKAWVPRKVKNQLAFGEYIFIRQVDLKLSILLIESIIAAAEAGIIDGSDAFLSSVRQILATHLKIRPDDIFSGSETLGDILKMTNILPFKTDLLLFTPEEVNTWKPADYKKMNQSLTEKLRYLREFYTNPNNLRIFEDVAYLYVPKGYFP